LAGGELILLSDGFTAPPQAAMQFICCTSKIKGSANGRYSICSARSGDRIWQFPAPLPRIDPVEKKQNQDDRQRGYRCRDEDERMDILSYGGPPIMKLS
jgi:hypothetical protein